MGEMEGDDGGAVAAADGRVCCGGGLGRADLATEFGRAQKLRREGSRAKDGRAGRTGRKREGGRVYWMGRAERVMALAMESRSIQQDGLLRRRNERDFDAIGSGDERVFVGRK